MRTKVLLALLFAALPSVSASAAIRYTFHQTSRSDIRDMPSADMSGHAVVDAQQSRIDFDGKTIYGDKAYILAFLPTRKMVIVDPDKKTIAEVNLANVASALAATKIDIVNFKKDFKKLPEHIEVAGVPTDHYRLEASYDMTVMFGSLPITQNVHTVVEKWTTSAFGDVSDLLSSNLLKSGNPQLDELIDSEMTGMKGLPLRTVVSVITGPSSGNKVTKSSQLNIAMRRQMSEMIISDIQVVPSDASLFVIPESYKRVDGTKADEPIHNLTLTQ